MNELKKYKKLFYISLALNFFVLSYLSFRAFRHVYEDKLIRECINKNNKNTIKYLYPIGIECIECQEMEQEKISK